MSLVVIESTELEALINRSVTTAIQAALSKEDDPFSHLPELLTRRQACEVLGVCLATLDNWVKAGKIEVQRLGMRTTRIRKSFLVKERSTLQKHRR